MIGEKIVLALSEWHEELNMPWSFYPALALCMEKGWEKDHKNENVLCTKEEAYVVNDEYWYVKSEVNFLQESVHISDIRELSIDEFLDLYNDKEYTKV